MHTVELQQLIDNLPTPDKTKPNNRREHNLTCVDSICSLLDLEDDITSNRTPELDAAVRLLILNCIPVQVQGEMSIWDLSENESENTIRASSIVNSPLLDRFSSFTTESLQDKMMHLVGDAIFSGLHSSTPSVPSNFTHLKTVLTTPSIVKDFLFYTNASTASIMSCSLLNDVSFLTYYQAKDFTHQFLKSEGLSAQTFIQYLNTHQIYSAIVASESLSQSQILYQYLEEHHTNPDLFWDLVNTLPDLSALTVLQLAEGER